MRKIRIGKDIAITWTLTVDGVSRDLAPLDLSLYLHDEARGTKERLSFTTTFDKVQTTILGTSQTQTGVYRMTIWLNEGKSGQTVLDDSTAYCLVPRTEMEGGSDDNLQTETVELAGDLRTIGDYTELERRVEALEGLTLTSATANASDVDLVHGEDGEADVVLATIPAATSETAGVMSAADKKKLSDVLLCYEMYLFDNITTEEEQWANFLAIFGQIASYSATATMYGAPLVHAAEGTLSYTLSFAEYYSGRFRVIQYIWKKAAGHERTNTIIELAPASAVPNGFRSIQGSGGIMLVHREGGITTDLFVIEEAGAGSGVMTPAQVTALNTAATDIAALQTSVAGKADKVGLTAIGTAAASVSPAAETYTRIDFEVGTLGIVLPSVTDNTKVTSLMISLTTGASPAVTFTSADNKAIAYYDGFAIEGNKKYEINCLFNGAQWILAYGTIA